MTQPQQEIVALLPEMRGFARSLAGGDPHLADDLVQDAVMLALRSWGSFQPGTNLKSWLLKILHNRFHSLKRRSYLKAEISTENLESLSWAPAGQEQSIELAAFKRAFKALKPEHRTALVLVGVHGLPYEEVAKVCGCEIGTVKSRVNRARAVLKGMLAGGLPATAPVAAARPAKRRPKAPAASARILAPIELPPIIASEPPPLSPMARLLAETDRAIVRAETQLTCYQQIASRLGRIQINRDGAMAMLHLAEQHLESLYLRRDRLLLGRARPLAILSAAQRPIASPSSQ